MKKTVLLALTTFACLVSCKKNEPVKPATKNITDHTFKTNIACPAPPQIIGVLFNGGNIAGRINVNAQGNVNVKGLFSGTVDFDPGAGRFSLTGLTESTYSVYNQILSPTGSFISAKNVAVFNGDLLAPVDAQGNTYLAKFPPYPANTGDPITVSKIGPSGSVLWQVNAGEYISNAFFGVLPENVVLDKNGNVLFSHPDGYIYVYNPAGGLIKIHEHSETSAGIRVDKNGNIYVFGETGRLQKYSPSGTKLWEIRNEPTVNRAPIIQALTVDNDGNIYATGIFTETSDMDPGPGVFKLVSSGLNRGDLFVQKLNSSGGFVWAIQTEGRGVNSAIRPYDVTIDNTTQNILIAGTIDGRVNFKPNTELVLTAPNGRAGFVLALKQCN